MVSFVSEDWLMSHNGVFISYRRGTGSEVARVLQEFLEGQGFDVFLDVDSLGAGHFDEQLLAQIESRRSFVLVCSPGSLDRCGNEGDWVRREIAHALKSKKHIVPVTLPQFTWPSGESLPIEVADLQRHNAFEYSHMHWRLIKPRLVEMLRASGTKKPDVQLAHSEIPPIGLRDDPQASSPPVSRAEPSVARESLGRRQPVRPAGLREGAPQAAIEWCEIMERAPDPSVVTDVAGCARMLETGLPWKVRHRNTGIVMLLCPPGEFTMGSPSSESMRGTYETQHARKIRRSYYLSATPVTQGQWQRAMGTNPSPTVGAGNPVGNVSWWDCRHFCANTGLRLASESEWEYACRAGTMGPYAGEIEQMVSRKHELTYPVGICKPNPWGFHDMHGNVWEWVRDAFAAYPVSGGTEEPWEVPGSDSRVMRGGGMPFNMSCCRSADRVFRSPEFTHGGVGFRVARFPFYE